MINKKKIIIIILFVLFLVLSLKTYNLEKFDNLKNNKKVFLISNNKKFNKKKLKKIIQNNKNHIYVFFNHMGPLWHYNNEDMKEFNKYNCEKILFVRENHLNSYWGKRELSSNKFIMFNNKNIFIIPSSNGNLKNLKNPYNYKILKFKHLIPKNYSTKKSKEPQTGFIAYQLLNQHYKNIFLVGFNRKNGEDPADWLHEKSRELDYYKKNNVPIINI